MTQDEGRVTRSKKIGGDMDKHDARESKKLIEAVASQSVLMHKLRHRQNPPT